MGRTPTSLLGDMNCTQKQPAWPHGILALHEKRVALPLGKICPPPQRLKESCVSLDPHFIDGLLNACDLLLNDFPKLKPNTHLLFFSCRHGLFGECISGSGTVSEKTTFSHFLENYLLLLNIYFFEAKN